MIFFGVSAAFPLGIFCSPISHEKISKKPDSLRWQSATGVFRKGMMAMSTQALITSRDPKGLHAVGLFETACNQSKLDDARAQRLNERGGELQNGIVKLIAELTTSN